MAADLGSAGTLTRTTDAGASIVPMRALHVRGRPLHDHAFRVVSLSAAIDARDVPGNPRSGGRYAIAANRYSAAPQRPYSFTQVDTEVEQHISFWKRQRVITLRAIASTAVTADGHAVPFYLQPTLGGSRAAARIRQRSLPRSKPARAAGGVRVGPDAVHQRGRFLRNRGRRIRPAHRSHLGIFVVTTGSASASGRPALWRFELTWLSEAAKARV